VTVLLGLTVSKILCERLTKFKQEVRSKLEQDFAACLYVARCSNVLVVADMEEVL